METSKKYRVAILWAAFTSLAPAACLAQSWGGCGGFKGEWNWTTSGAFTSSGVVTLKEDQSVLYKGQPAGTWECKDDARHAAAIHWATGFVDSVTLTGDHISGTSTMQGVRVSAIRKESARVNPTPAPVTQPNPAPKPPSAQPNPGSKPDSVLAPSADTAKPDARLATGWCVIDHDNYRQAIAFLDSVLSRNPRDAQALYYRGRCWHYANQEQQAIQDLTASLEIDPRNSWAYLYRGRAWVATNGVEHKKYKAEADFIRAIQADYRNGDAYFALAVLYAANFVSKDVEALQAATLTIQLKPRFAEAYVLRAEISMDHNRVQDAMADLNQAKALDPNYPDLDCRYGLAYWIAGQRQLGDQWLSRCYAHDPAARPVYEQEKNVKLQIAAENARRAAAIRNTPCSSHSWGFCSGGDSNCKMANQTSYDTCMSWHRN